jgi:Transposase DDE domain.
MDNNNHISVIRQWLSLLPINVLDRTLFDRYAKKLTIMKTILIFLAAQLNRWSSYEEIENQIHAHPQWQSLLQLTRISGSQLSRKLDQIPTELLEWMMVQGVAQVQALSSARGHNGITSKIGKLGIVDSSVISLPLRLCDWAALSPKECGVKMHLRLIADSPDSVYPDAILPTNVAVDDRYATLQLVTESDVTYVMDRGYEDFRKMDNWLSRDIKFVLRVRERVTTTCVEAYPVPEGSSILTDAKVKVGSSKSNYVMKRELRLVVFRDSKGRLYKLLTSRWDASAEEIAHIYKCRWLIELFFKWIKQHLRLVKVYSYKPQALWNQLFLGLLTSLLVLQIQLSTQTKRTPWQVLQLLRMYMYSTWTAFEVELNRQPTRRSRGRQPSAERHSTALRTSIGVIQQRKEKAR